MFENLGYELDEDQIARELRNADAVNLEPEDLEEEYDGEMWDRVMKFFHKHPSILPKIIPAQPKSK